MDPYSEDSHLQNKGYVTNLSSNELSSLERDHEEAQPHFDVDEPLEVQLRFELGSLVDTHVLIDTEGARESHWDFVRQEQGRFQASSHENNALLSHGKQDDLKSFDNCESWPRSAGQVDTQLFIDAQDDVSMITEAFGGKDKSMADLVEDDRGLLLSSTYRQCEEETAWIGEAKEGLEEKAHNSCREGFIDGAVEASQISVKILDARVVGEGDSHQSQEDEDEEEVEARHSVADIVKEPLPSADQSCEAEAASQTVCKSKCIVLAISSEEANRNEELLPECSKRDLVESIQPELSSINDVGVSAQAEMVDPKEEVNRPADNVQVLCISEEEPKMDTVGSKIQAEPNVDEKTLPTVSDSVEMESDLDLVSRTSCAQESRELCTSDVLVETTCEISVTGKSFITSGGSSLDNTLGGSRLESESGLADQVEKQSALTIQSTEVNSEIEDAQGIATDNVSVLRSSQETTVLSILEASRTDDKVAGKVIASCVELEKLDERNGQTASKLAAIEPEVNSVSAATSIDAMPTELLGVCSMPPLQVLEQGDSHESGTEGLENKNSVSSLEQAEAMQGISTAADLTVAHPSHDDIALRHAHSSDVHGDLEGAGNNTDCYEHAIEGNVDSKPLGEPNDTPANADSSSKELLEKQVEEQGASEEQLANDGGVNESKIQEQKSKQHSGEENPVESTLLSAKPSLSNESKVTTEVSHPDGILHVLLDVHKEGITDGSISKNKLDKDIVKLMEGEGLGDVQTSNTGDVKVTEGCSDTHLSGSVGQVAVSGFQEDPTPSKEKSGKRKADSSARNNRLKDSARASPLQVRPDQEQKNAGTEGLGRRKSTSKTPVQKKGADAVEGFASLKKPGSKSSSGRKKRLSTMVHDSEASPGATEGSQTPASIAKTFLSVNAKHHASPDLNGLEVPVPMVPPSQPFSEPQQVQLRAQILVYGSLIQGAAPEEALMAAAFSNVTGVQVGGAPEASGRAVWAKQWQTAVDRIHAKTSRDSLKDSSRAVTALLSNSPVTTAKAAEGGLKTNGSPGMANALIDGRSAAGLPARASDVTGSKSQTSRPKQPPDSAHDIAVGRSNQPIAAAAPLGPITSTASRSTPSLSESFIQPAKPRADSQTITPQNYFPPPPLGPFITGAPQWFSNTSFPGSWMPQSQAGVLNNPPALFTHPQSVVSSDPTPETRRSTPSSSGTLMPASSFGPTLFTPVVGGMSVMPTPIPDLLQNKQPVSESRPRKRKKSHSESHVSSADVNFSYATHMPTGQVSLGIASPVYSPPPTAPEVLALVVANTQMPKSSQETSLLGMLGSKVSAPSSTNMPSAGPPSLLEKSVNLQNSSNQMSHAQASAEEAAVAAASAIRESESLWSQLKAQKAAGLTPNNESQLVSSAYTMATAASVAKAAAAAAKAAYEAAVQAKRISEGVLEGGKQANDSLSSRLLGDKTGDASQAWGMPESCNSVLAAAKIASKQRLEAVSVSRVRAENFESVVRAAELATNAITQVGCIMAMGESVPFTLDMLLEVGPEGLHRLEDKGKTKPRVTALRSPSRAGTPKSIERERKFRSKITSGKDIATQRDGQLDNWTSDSVLAVRPENEARNNTELGVGLLTDFSKQKTTDHVTPSMPASRQGLVITRTEGGLMEQEALVADNKIVKGSVVEVMSDEKGLRGVWFSARVQSVDDEKVFVLYDDLLADDGYSPLEEWIQLKGSSGKAPRVRRAHPSTNIGFEGTRKRRREAMGSHKWSVGDRVDAWIRDGWWEGEIKEIIEDGESKAKVFFPGDGDTSIVKTSKLRPSLVWSNGHWVLWIDAKQGKKESSRARPDSHEGDTPLAKRQRTEKAQASGPLKQKLVPGSAAEASATHKESIVLESNTANLLTDLKGFTADGIAKPKPQGTKVVFGVPRPTKKRKLIEVSKHFGSVKGVSGTSASDAKTANNKSEGVLVYAPGSSETSRLDASKAKKRALHLPKARPQKGTDPDVKASTMRTNKEKSIVASKTLVRKNAPSKEGMPSAFKNKEGKVMKQKNLSSDRNQLEPQEQSEDRALPSNVETHTSSTGGDDIGKESSLGTQKNEKLNDAGKENGMEPSQATQENEGNQTSSLLPKEKAKQSSQQAKDSEVPSSAPASGNKSTSHSSKKNETQPSKVIEEVAHKVKGSESQPTHEGEKRLEVSSEKQPATLVNNGEKESSYPTKESEKSKDVGKPTLETWEPRRTSRKIQPTSKLLEGLQTAPKLGKNSSSHDRGSRGGTKAPPQP